MYVAFCTGTAKTCKQHHFLRNKDQVVSLSGHRFHSSCCRMGRIRLLLILGALQGSLSQSIQVSQILAVTTTPGNTVTLQCNYTFNRVGRPTSGWFTWYRHVLNGPVVSDTNKDFMGRVTRSSPSDFINSRQANIVLHRVDPSDTGMYICEVGLHDEMISGYGNGTFLNVTGSHTRSIYVSQIPTVTTTLGSTATLHCNYSFTSLEKPQMVDITWYRQEMGGPELSDTNPDAMGRVFKTSMKDVISVASASTELRRVDSRDQGLYVCQVFLQFKERIISSRGNGTYLRVTGLEPNPIIIQNLVRIVLSVLILVVALPVLLYYGRKGEGSLVGSVCAP